VNVLNSGCHGHVAAPLSVVPQALGGTWCVWRQAHAAVRASAYRGHALTSRFVM
jgi:hypothetical protein